MYKVGVYIRLSKEDDKYKESESVKNQRDFISEYLNHHNLKIANEYIDDGYSGTTFNRPGFNKMIEDIENKKINMVITKDLSRLGRNYIKSGYYIEEYFPHKKVRYVSILDNVDTYQNSSLNDIAPFKALFNDMVSKDTSRKIKSILHTKKTSGLYLSPKAPFGYIKKNKYDLVVDKDKSTIVKKIYNDYLNNISIKDIASNLNKKNIPSPNNRKWSYTSIYNILKNREYTGIIVQNVWTNLSYKSKLKIKNNKEDWIIHNNHHEPIIDNITYIKANKKLKQHKVKRKRYKLEGLVYCRECGHTLGINRINDRIFFTCNNYKKNKKCFSHYINYKKVEEKIKNTKNVQRIEIDKDKNIFIKKTN